MQVYNLEVRVQLYDSYSEVPNFLWLFKKITLPFPPYPGLTVVDGDWSASIGKVVYLANENAFIASVSPMGYPPPTPEGEKMTKEEFIESYIKSGWKKLENLED